MEKTVIWDGLKAGRTGGIQKVSPRKLDQKLGARIGRARAQVLIGTSIVTLYHIPFLSLFP